MTEVKRLTDKPSLVPLALVGLAVLGGVLRYLAAGQDLFADELATYWIVSAHDLPGVVQTVSTTAEITPPLGFVLSWLTTRIELSPEFVRLPALIAGIGSIPLVYAVGARTVGRAAGLLAAVLTTLSPFMIFYSAEARGYSVLMALVLLSTLLLLIAVDTGRRRWWAAYAVMACLAAYTHYTSIFVLGGQFLWAFWARPGSRKPLLLATGAAALLYAPWLPSLKGDLDSPTTEILDFLSPFSFESVRVSLSHWALGFPDAQFVPSLRELPGIPALLIIAAAISIGAVRLITMPQRIGSWFAGRGWRTALVFALAIATPLGAAVQSAAGTDVFSTRSLAPSWPYLALAGAAVITAGAGRLRLVAAALAVAGFGISAATLMTDDFERPNYRQVARFVESGPGGVLVDSASRTPGPLGNFDVVGSSPDVRVFRLIIPEQRSRPFDLSDQYPDPVELARRVGAEADGEPITVVAPVSDRTLPGLPSGRALAAEFAEHLPAGYSLSESRRFPGFMELEALVYEKNGGPG